MNLPPGDLALVVVLLAALVWVGCWARRYTRSVAHFTVAGRGMGMWLGLGAAVAESIGLVSIANSCQQGFRNGFSFIWLGLAVNLCISIPLFGIMGLGIKRYRATRVQTLPQYYEMRYSRRVRLFAGITLALGGVLNMAIFPIVESHFLLEFLNIPNSVVFDAGFFQFTMFRVVLAILLALAVFFTMIGGMVTVIVTDYLQSVLILMSITVITFLVFRVAGVANIMRAVDTHLGAAAFNTLSRRSIGPVFVVVFILGSIIQRLAFPPSLQKMSAAKSPEVVRKMFLLSTIFTQGRGMMFVAWGLAALALFGPEVPAGYDPEVYGRVVGGRLIATVVKGVPLIKGLALTAFLFASISTNDSYLLSWASVIANDCIAAARRKPLSREGHLRALKFSSVGIAVFIFLFGCWYTPKETILQFFYLTGAIFGACGLVTWFGLYWRRANSPGAWACLITGLVLPVGWFVFQKYFGHVLESEAHRGLARWINSDYAALWATVVPALAMIAGALGSRSPARFVEFDKKSLQ